MGELMDLRSPSVVFEDTLSTMIRNSRTKPCHTLGVSILSIAHKTIRKAEEHLPLPSPIISITKTLGRIASPIVYTLENHWLHSLSFTDMQILAVESLVEFIIPSSSYVFDTVDDLVHIAVGIVAKCENVVDEFPDSMYEMLYSVSNMMYYSKGFVGDKEKGFESGLDWNEVANDTMKLQSEEKVATDVVEGDVIEDHLPENEKEKDSDDVVVVDGGKTEKKDPILDLFAEGWYMR